MMKKMKG